MFRTIAILCAALLPTLAVRADQAPPPSTTRIAGVAWHASFDAACALARERNKPVLLLEMIGRLDQEHC